MKGHRALRGETKLNKNNRRKRGRKLKRTEQEGKRKQ